MREKITVDPCSDHDIIVLAVGGAKALAEKCKTAIVILTSACKQDGHGIHVTAAVLNATGSMTPRETRAAVKRLRSLADELEQRFTPEGSEN